MTSTATKALRQSLPRRSLRILVSPPPITFAERRSVLQAIQQFGTIEVFQMTPGYHSNYISVTKDEATAKSLLMRSPLGYSVSATQSGTEPAHRITNKHTDNTKSRALRGGHTDSGTQEPSKQFTLVIVPARYYKHETAMSRSPLAQAWPSTYDKDETFLSATLKQSLPPNVAAKGLAHWSIDAENAPKNTAERTRLELKNWLPSNMARQSAPMDKNEDGANNSNNDRRTSRYNDPAKGPDSRPNKTSPRPFGMRQMHGEPWVHSHKAG